MKQEAYLCDICFKIFHFPQYSIFHMILFPEHDPKEKLELDLCHDDYEKVLKAIQLIREEKL